MRCSSLFLSFFLSSIVIARGHGGDFNSTREISDKSICREMRHLTKLVDTAANTTKLADKTNNNPTKIAAFQAKASAASAKLATMSTNTTLVSTCAVVNAAEATKDDCRTIENLTELMAIMGNATAIEGKTHGNTTRMAKFQARVAQGTAKLQSLQANGTLMAECARLKAERAARKGEGENGTAIAGAGTAATSGSAAAVEASDATLVVARSGVLFTALLVTFGVLVL